MIDLHMHTNKSDGTDSVEELLEKAEKEQLEIISITDHDSIDAYYDLENEKIRNRFSGKIIIGAELKTFYKGVPIEVLAYGIDYKKIKIHKIKMYELQKKILEEYKKIGKKLGLKFDENIFISETDSMKKFASFTFASEILKYEENKNILFSIGPECDAATFYRVHASNKDSIFYYDESRESISLEETLIRIHDAGGIAFLAHPYLYPYKNKEEIIEEIVKDFEIDGLECEYPLFSKQERDGLKKIATKYNKYMSGGTDYHAKNKPDILIGKGIKGNINITKDLIKLWINKVKTI